MSEQTASQSGGTPEVQEAIQDWKSAFGIDPGIIDDEADDENEATEAPAAKQVETKPEGKKLVVKFNKEEVEVDGDKVPELVQKGLALDKEREKRGEYEKALDRAAKLQGYKDHAELLANLDRIEREREESQKREFDELQQRMIDELELNGVSREAAIAYLQNNPVLQQAQQAIIEKEQTKFAQESAKQQAEYNRKWADLYEAQPDLLESAKAFNDGGRPDWYTPDMEAKIQRGYDPLDAYRLAHADKIQTQTKKQTEQQIIKQQQLGKRAAVETIAPADDSPEVPDSVKSAFSMFGIDPRRAAKHFKK